MTSFSLSRFRKLFIDSLQKSIEHLEIEYDFDYSNNGGPSILILTENINATYYLSFHFPLLNAYEKGLVNFRVLCQKSVGHNVDKCGDSCFIERLISIERPKTIVFTRYARPFGKELVDSCKRAGIPVIYHIDDDLLRIPNSLGKDLARLHGSKGIIEKRRYIMTQADLIYTSTDYLRDVLSEKFSQPMVTGIYAPYLDYLIDNTKSQFNSKLLTVGYMGSRGHQLDLALVVPALARIMDENPSIRFEVFGTISMPKELERFRGRVKAYIVTQNYIEFLESLKNLNWDIGLAPLSDTTFNKCKAPTKFVEYTCCSIPTIASDINVYGPYVDNTNGILSNDGDWYHNIKRLIENPNLRDRYIQNAKKYCSSVFSIDILESQLMSILDNL